VSEAERAERWATVLLDRHGIVAYEHFEGEAAPVPWQAVAAVLRRMEMRGEARRGHFLADLGGMQFAHPTAVERVRDAGGEGAMRLVAAMDPANPYGAALAAPGEGFARIPNAYLVLEGGRAVLRVDGGGRRVVPVDGLAGEHLYAALATLTTLARVPAPYRGRAVEVAEYGEVAAAQSAAAEALSRVGFEPSGGAMVLWPSKASRSR
jgi:ATP-dependent Lhr-like helicase